MVKFPTRLGALLVAFSLICFSICPPALAKKGVTPRPIEDMASGLPDIGKGPLNRASFRAVKARKLAHARMVMVNLDALREMGVAVPEEGATPEFIQELLDQWAWAIPGKKDDPSKFTSETKTFYADKYGGSGIGNNAGSARAMAAGSFQLKAAGVTPLIEDKTENGGKTLIEKFKWWLSNFKHSGGKMGLPEAANEYYWGEILHRELPYGANRVVAIIDSGLANQSFPGVNEPAAIIVRQNSLRPAHFITNMGLLEKNPLGETERMEKLNKSLEEALPKPENWNPPASQARRIADEFNEFVDRLGKVFGTEYALGIYHGSTSPSNIDLSGEALDHFSNTTLNGFPKITFADPAPNGSIKNFLDFILYEFVDDLQDTLPPAAKKLLPDHAAIRKRLSEDFRKQIKQTLLWIAGTPDEYAAELAQTDAGNKLAITLYKVAKAGNDATIPGRIVPSKNLGTYDFNRIVRRLARTSGDPGSLSDLISDPDLRSELAQRYLAYMSALTELAAKDGVSSDSLRTYIVDATSIRARTLPQAMRTRTRFFNLYVRSYTYALTHNPRGISSYVNDVIESTARRYQNVPPFRLVLQERRDFQTGTMLRRVFNLKTGGTEVLLQAPVAGDQVDFFGKQVPVEALSAARMEIDSKSNAAQGKLMNPPADGDDYVTFDLPENGQGIDLDRFQVTLDAPNGSFSNLRIIKNSQDPELARMVPSGLPESQCEAALLNR